MEDVKVGGEQIWIAGVAMLNNIWLGWSISLLGGSNACTTTVHVHLTIADLVEPSPSNSIVALFETGWNCVLEGRGTAAIGISWQVTSDVCWTTTFNRLDDHPFGTLGGFEISSKRHLARTTTVDGTTGETESVCNTRNDVVDIVDGVGHVEEVFAWEITAVVGER